MKKRISHSFIILAYKESPFLENCIKSLLKQTLKSQIAISTSTPSQYLNNISKKYQIPIIVSKGRSIVNDWTFAFNSCKTKYLTLAHQDDIYLPLYTETCYKLGERQNSSLVFTNYYEINKKNKKREPNKNLIIKRLLLTPFYLKNNIEDNFVKKLVLSFGNPICCPSCFYNKKKIGKFKFRQGMKYVMDWEAWWRLSNIKGAFSYVKQKVMIHRIHAGSETSLQIADKNRFKEEKKMLENIWRKWLAQMISFVYRSGAKTNIME